MPVAVPSTPGGDPGLAARVAAGPGLWEDEDWLADLHRESLIGSLLADGTIAAAAAAEHAHEQERALNAEVTALCLVTGALFPVLGYDPVLALVFGMPGTAVRPGTPVPAGPAYSKARERHGEAPARAMFRHDAARGGIPAGPDGTAFGLELTQIDGTTLELFNDPLLAEEFGVPSPRAKPLLRLVGLLHSGTRRQKAAVIGRYLDGENALADGLQDAFGPGQLNLADRGFLSVDRWTRFSGTGAHLLWRVKNAAKSVPFRTLHLLKDGSELVLLRESNEMRARRRKTAGDPALLSLPDTTARLICFTVLTRTRSGRVKTTQIRLLTTLLDPGACPAGELAVLYQKRWLINRVPPPEADRPRRRPRPARTLRRPRPPGNLGAPARPQHDRRTRRPRRRHRRPDPGRDHLHRRAVPRPRRDHRRHLLPPLPQAPGQRKRPDRCTRRRDHCSSARTRRPPADLRPHPSRTTEMDQRTSRLHPHHHPVKPPENRRKSQKLRAVGSGGIPAVNGTDASHGAPGWCRALRHGTMVVLHRIHARLHARAQHDLKPVRVRGTHGPGHPITQAERLPAALHLPELHPDRHTHESESGGGQNVRSNGFPLLPRSESEYHGATPMSTGLAGVQAFEGLAGKTGDDLEVHLQVQDGQAGQTA